MTREAVNRILRQMEQIRHDSYEADSEKDVRRLAAEYGRLWKIVKPYCEGTKPFADEARHG